MAYEREVEVLRAKLAVLEAERDDSRRVANNISEEGTARIAQSDAIYNAMIEMYTQMIKLLQGLDIIKSEDIPVEENLGSSSTSRPDQH